MSHILENIWSFRTENFSVFVDAMEEDCSPEGHFDNPADVEAIFDGDVEWFQVRAFVLGPNNEVLAEEWLGGCAYTTFDNFRCHMNPDPDYRNTLANNAKGICICTYFADMVRTVCQEARNRMRQVQSIRVR